MKILLALALAACSQAQPVAPAAAMTVATCAEAPTPPAPRNFAAEDVALADKSLVCKPQFATDTIHTCVIEAKQMVCAVTAASPVLVCGPLFPKPAEKAPDPAPVVAPTKAEAPKKK